MVTAEALAPFRTGRPERRADDPALLDYLDDPKDEVSGNFLIQLEAYISSLEMRTAGKAARLVSSAEMKDAAYWTAAQMIAHHASNGCNLRPGDLLGTGTLSGSQSGQEGSLMELTSGGSEPIFLEDGQPRFFLEDGDQVTLQAKALAQGCRSIGFGSCTGTVVPTAESIG